MKDKIGEKTLEIMNKAKWYNNWLLQMMAPYLSGEILEVGAGTGNFTKGLSKFGKVTAIDIDPNYKNARYGDIEKGKYFFHRKTFDTIVCMNVLEHIKDDKKALKNMFNLLNRGGKLILLVPAHQWAYGTMDKVLGHYRRYTPQALNRLLSGIGYQVSDIRYLNFLGLLGWFVNARLLKRTLLPESQLGLFDKIARPFLILENFVQPPFGLSVLAIGEKK